MADIQLRSDVGVTLIDSVGSDQAVVATARVSVIGASSKEWLDVPAEESEGLIRFLMKNRHGTPFEHNQMTFLIEAPIMVFREFHRHRIGWSYNEESGRYKQLAPVFYAPGPDRPLVQEGKPGAYTFIPGTERQQKTVISELVVAYAHAYETYETLLEDGIAKEIARSCLPVAIFSSMYATCNARSLMSFLSLRTKRSPYWRKVEMDIRGLDESLYFPDPGGSMFPSFPMKEIEMVADKMEAEWAKLMPVTHAAFNALGRVAP